MGASSVRVSREMGNVLRVERGVERFQAPHLEETFGHTELAFRRTRGDTNDYCDRHAGTGYDDILAFRNPFQELRKVVFFASFMFIADVQKRITINRLT